MVDHIRVLTTSFLMTLNVIAPIHLNLSIRPNCVLKADIRRKNMLDYFMVT